MENDERQTLSVLVENKSGVLSRIAGLFSGRGFNIASLSVGETDDPDVSRMTIVVEADKRTLEQVVKQLRKLIVTIKVEDYSSHSFVSSELLLIKVAASPEKRGEIMDIVDVFDGKIVDMTHNYLTVRFVGKNSRINDVIDLLESYGIKEMARTGTVALGSNK